MTVRRDNDDEDASERESESESENESESEKIPETYMTISTQYSRSFIPVPFAACHQPDLSTRPHRLDRS
jgi:hypothetical protein